MNVRKSPPHIDNVSGEHCLPVEDLDLFAASRRVLLVAPAADLEAMAPRESFQLSSAHSLEVLELYALSPLDLVVVDASGLPPDACLAARASSRLSSVPVLLIEGEHHGREMLRRFGADDHVPRPIDPEVLIRRMRLLGELGRQRRLTPLFGAALEASTTALTVADAQHPDLPLAYVSPAFERLTGYSASEAVGRNCRFLQVFIYVALDRQRANLAMARMVVSDVERNLEV